MGLSLDKPPSNYFFIIVMASRTLDSAQRRFYLRFAHSFLPPQVAHHQFNGISISFFHIRFFPPGSTYMQQQLINAYTNA